MTDAEMMECYRKGTRVQMRERGNTDYDFEGRIVAVFSKWEVDEFLRPMKYRCVIQDDRRFLVIQSAKNIEVVTTFTPL